MANDIPDRYSPKKELSPQFDDARSEIDQAIRDSFVLLGSEIWRIYSRGEARLYWNIFSPDKVNNFLAEWERTREEKNGFWEKKSEILSRDLLSQDELSLYRLLWEEDIKKIDKDAMTWLFIKIWINIYNEIFWGNIINLWDVINWETVLLIKELALSRSRVIINKEEDPSYRDIKQMFVNNEFNSSINLYFYQKYIHEFLPYHNYQIQNADFINAVNSVMPSIKQLWIFNVIDIIFSGVWGFTRDWKRGLVYAIAKLNRDYFGLDYDLSNEDSFLTSLNNARARARLPFYEL